MRMLEIDDLHVHYGRMPAVQGVSLHVNRGELVCVVGPNGAGKSTTLSTIVGLKAPSRGRIALAGESLLGKPPEAVAARGVSLVPEGRRVFGRLTVKENIMLGAGMRADKREAEADFLRMLDYFPFMRDRLSTPGGRLSGGEQQQLVIARALMTRPRIMLVDEPSLGLAPQMIDKVYAILDELRKAGNTLLIVEQSAHRALENADRIYVLREGRIQFHGIAGELTDQSLEQAYFGFRSEHGEDDVHF